MRIIVRADSGYFTGALLDLLDAQGHGYLIKVKLKNLAALLTQQHWTAIAGQPDWEQCTFDYRCGDWQATRRIVAVRQRLPKAESPQLDLLETTEYDTFCYVTTEALTPWQAHKKYGERATCETWIEEAKGQMGMGKIRTANFLANAALFHCAVLAYNTLRWMAIMSGSPALRQWEPETVRTYLVRVAGKLLTGNRQLTVKTPDNHLILRFGQRARISRKLKWDPSDFSGEKLSWRLLPSAARVRPASAAAHNSPSVRCTPLAYANDLTPCRMALHFDYASAAAPTSSKRPAPTATRGSSSTRVTLPVLLR